MADFLGHRQPLFMVSSCSRRDPGGTECIPDGSSPSWLNSLLKGSSLVPIILRISIFTDDFESGMSAQRLQMELGILWKLSCCLPRLTTKEKCESTCVGETKAKTNRFRSDSAELPVVQWSELHLQLRTDQEAKRRQSQEVRVYLNHKRFWLEVRNEENP